MKKLIVMMVLALGLALVGGCRDRSATSAAYW